MHDDVIGALGPSDDRLVLVLHLQRKRTFLHDLATRMDELRSVDDDTLRRTMVSITKEIKGQLRTFDRLTQIERAIATVTSTFCKQLKTAYPVLTSTELHVCAYLRTGLSARQSAELMFVTPRAVEKHRQSIRRKLGMDDRTDLPLWLRDFAERTS